MLFNVFVSFAFTETEPFFTVVPSRTALVLPLTTLTTVVPDTEAVPDTAAFPTAS